MKYELDIVGSFRRLIRLFKSYFLNIFKNDENSPEFVSTGEQVGSHGRATSELKTKAIALI